MSIIVADKEFKTLSDEFFVNGKKVIEAYLGDGTKVYPDFDGIEMLIPFRSVFYGGSKAIEELGPNGTLVKAGLTVDNWYETNNSYRLNGRDYNAAYWWHHGSLYDGSTVEPGPINVRVDYFLPAEYYELNFPMGTNTVIGTDTTWTTGSGRYYYPPVVSCNFDGTQHVEGRLSALNPNYPYTFRADDWDYGTIIATYSPSGGMTNTGYVDIRGRELRLTPLFAN